MGSSTETTLLSFCVPHLSRKSILLQVKLKLWTDRSGSWLFFVNRAAFTVPQISTWSFTEPLLSLRSVLLPLCFSSRASSTTLYKKGLKTHRSVSGRRKQAQSVFLDGGSCSMTISAFASQLSWAFLQQANLTNASQAREGRSITTPAHLHICCSRSCQIAGRIACRRCFGLLVWAPRWGRVLSQAGASKPSAVPVFESGRHAHLTSRRYRMLERVAYQPTGCIAPP